MKFCPVVHEICRGQVHVPKRERRKRRKENNNKKKWSKNNKSDRENLPVLFSF
jgi:hypothetical protein